MSIYTEVLRIFVDAQRLSSGNAGPNAAFAAPWREAGPSGVLGPEYLPRSPITGGPVPYHQANAEHREGRYPFSEGLFDHREHLRMSRKHNRPLPAENRALERYDAPAVERFMGIHSHRVPQRELEVYTAYWVEGRSCNGTARHLGVAPATVKDIIKRIRARVMRS